MEIAIDYNENARAVTRKEAQKQMSIFVLSRVLQRKQTSRNGDEMQPDNFLCHGEGIQDDSVQWTRTDTNKGPCTATTMSMNSK